MKYNFNIKNENKKTTLEWFNTKNAMKFIARYLGSDTTQGINRITSHFFCDVEGIEFSIISDSFFDQFMKKNTPVGSIVKSELTEKTKTMAGIQYKECQLEIEKPEEVMLPC